MTGRAKRVSGHFVSLPDRSTPDRSTKYVSDRSAMYGTLFYKNVIFPAQAEYSYFSADFRLKIFLYYS